MDAKTERHNRSLVNRDLREICSEYHEGLALSQIDETLTVHGFKALESGVYCGRDGQIHEQVGEHTWLSLTWHKMDVSGRYELVAYVS